MTGIHITQFAERAARLSPDAPAIRFADRQSTWGSFNQATRAIAGGFRARGLGADDRVAILALNSDRYAEILFGLWRVSALAVPFNTRWAVDEMNFALADCSPTMIIVDDAFSAMLPKLDVPACVRNTVFIGDGDAPQNSLGIKDLMAEGEPVQGLGRGGEHAAGIFYTGGTTGHSKGVLLTHTGLVTSLLSAQAEQVKTDAPSPFLCVLPMFHLAGAQLVIAAAIVAAPIIMMSGFDLDEILQCVQQDRIETLSLVPAMWGMLIAHPSAAGTDLSSLKNAAYGASPMPEGILRSCIARLPGARFSQGYGQTETAGVCTLLGPDDHDPDAPTAHRLRSAGQATPFVEIKITDEDGHEKPCGEIGEILIRSTGNMLGYWNRPEETAATLRDGWIWSGDAGYLDADNYLFIVDRTKDMIISGGENVYSAETESALSQHPDVLECAVIGVPDEKWGERVHAVVRLVPGRAVTAEALIAFCKEKIAGYKCPRSIDFRDEPLPLSAAGKILKRDLRAPYWKDADRSVN